MRFTILGCGSSPGVPRIGGDWGVCDPAEPRNRRRRCSLLVERLGPGGVTRVLIDTSPDLREQSISAGFDRLDAVLYTHAHADHLHGIDDLRQFFLNMRRRIDIYGDAATLARIRQGFGYCFETPAGSDYPPILNAHRIRPGEPVRLQGPGGLIEALPIEVEHGLIHATAYRIGDLVYMPDVSGIPADAAAALAGLDVWIVDALRDKPHPSHLSLAETLAWIERLRPRQAVLTHMHIELDYRELSGRLPPGVVPAYDGMVLELLA